MEAVLNQHLLCPPGSIVNLAPDHWTAPFWAAAARHELVAARCQACGTFRSPPSPFCHVCQSQLLEWVRLSGIGVVYTFTVLRKALTPALEGFVPFAVAVVELPDAPGVRLVTNVVNVGDGALKIGLEVEVIWDDIEPGVTIPRFQPRPKDTT